MEDTEPERQQKPAGSVGQAGACRLVPEPATGGAAESWSVTCAVRGRPPLEQRRNPHIQAFGGKQLKRESWLETH